MTRELREALRREVFTGPRWLTAPKGFRPRKIYELAYYLFWPEGEVMVELEDEDHSILVGLGETGAAAHEQLVETIRKGDAARLKPIFVGARGEAAQETR